MATDIVTVLHNYEKMNSVIIETIQSQATTIQKLTNENTSLKQHIEQLEANAAAAQQSLNLSSHNNTNAFRASHVPADMYSALTAATPPTPSPTSGFDPNAFCKSLLDGADADDDRAQSYQQHEPLGGVYSLSAPTTTFLCFVSFKRDVVLCFQSCERFPVGQHVLVSADRGEDIGTVRVIAPMSAMNHSNNRSEQRIRGHVVRVATKKDIQQMEVIAKEIEPRCLEVCRALIGRQRLNMNVVDVAVQFDRKKITYFYTSTVRIDFRSLLGDLYQLFHARIWMDKVS
eukprot:PhF_6_TR2561/c0_g1_i1/m.4341